MNLLSELPLRRSAKLLIVDDQASNVRLLELLLRRAGYQRVTGTTDPLLVLPLFRELEPDLVLLDLNMPHLDGFQILELIAEAAGRDRFVPVLVITSDVSDDARNRALRLGATDFLTKPFSNTEVLLRCRNLLATRALHVQMESRVRERTSELEEARLEVLDRLARAAEFRDDVTGQHTRRVGELAARLGNALGFAADEAERIGRAATLHDVGKVGIPDHILLKPARLTEEEFRVMKTHTSLGADLLSGGRSPLLHLAEQIARSHHERWDGTGYPDGLRGDDIPLPARIVAVVDFFDALSSDRPYRRAWPPEAIIAEISAGSNAHFDPRVVDAFLSLVATPVPG